MRKKLLGAVAAMVAGAGSAAAQAPVVPVQYTNPPIPAMIPGPGGQPVPALTPGPGMIPPGVDPSFPLPPDRMPTYPPPGPYGQTMYESPYGGGGGGGPAGPLAPRVWFKGEYLLMFLKNQPSRTPLISTGTPNGGTDNGVPGQATTVNLFGQENFRFDPASGFRLELGLWADPEQRLGASVGALVIPTQRNRFAGEAALNGTPLFGRPFFNTNPLVPTVNGAAGGPDNARVTGPGFANGAVFGEAATKFYTLDGNVLVNLYREAPGGRNRTLNFIAGYKYMELQESIHVTSRSSLLGGATFGNTAIPAGANVIVADRFDARNQFNGGQIGLDGTVSGGRWFLSATGKAAFGINHQTITVDGSTSDGGTNAFVGGVYANTANIGKYRFDRFAVNADLNATVGYQLTPRLAATVGYNFVYFGNAARPGNAINPFIDPTTAPGVPNVTAVAPAGASGFDISRDDFWAHGFNFGFNLTY